MSDPVSNSSPRPTFIRSGDRTVLAAAFEEHRPRLVRTVSFRLDPRLVGRVDPDDVLQEAYLAAEQRCEHVQGDTEHELFIWLRLIAVQTLIDVHRRHLGTQKRDADREVALPAAGFQTATSMSIAAAGLIASITSPSAAFRRAERVEQLRAALEQMDEVDREVLALRHFEELDNHEVAAVLGIEQKAASIRYVRALRRLKSIMSDITGADSAPAGSDYDI